MQVPAIHELQQHAAALRRLARDLVGAAGADDVLQDAAIEVLRAPPRRPGPLLAWLRQVVRHVASKQRRAEVVRRRHETAAASERSFETSGAATVDALRQLTDWIAELAEPYRTTLLARYVQELTPTAIAAASGVPVRTVKTRLQRGLQLLRERGERSGGDWRGALALAFGLDAREVAPAGVAGAVLMGTMAKSGVAVGALALVALAVWQWSGGGGAAALPPSSPPPGAPVVAAVSDAPPKLPVEAPAERTPGAVPVPPPPTPRASADEIVVRVVDAASGQPVLAFGLREHMSPQRPMLGGQPLPLLHAGEHVDGRVVLPASAFVDRVYVAEDTAGSYLPSRWFAATDAADRDGERTIEVRMTAPVEVRVRVVRERTGEAVAGTRVELIRPWIVPHAVTPMTMAAPSDHFRAQPNENAMMMNFIGGRALLLGDVNTDAAGVAVLRVPPDERLVLRLTAALHRTVIVEPWQAPPEPREVVIPVAMGAAVRGRVTPASALAALHARIPERFRQNQDLAQLCTTGVRFQHVGSGEYRPPGMLGRTPVTLADDGSFELGGLAPGTWRMYFRYALNVEREAPGRFVLPQHFEIELPNIEALTDGELRIVDVDVSEWVPGTLRAQLPRDDRMGEEGSLALHQIASVGPPLAMNRGQVGLHAAPGDRIEVSIPPARYLAIWHRPNTMTNASGAAQLVVRSSFVLGEVEVRARAVTAVDLTLDADTTSIQVFEADGTTPVRGRLRVQRAGWNAGIDVDANGAATFDAMPRAFELKATFHRWNAERPNGPFLDAIDLGMIRAGGKPIVLRLPPR